MMDKQLLRDLVKGFSIETTVRDSQRFARYGDLLHEGTQVYLPHVPGHTAQEMVALALRLRKDGMEPVPHIVARRIETAAILDEYIGRLVGDAGVKQVLVVAGDIQKPVGELESALQILDMGLLEKHGIRRIGVAGHPEGHRDISEAMLRDALTRKNEYARRTGAELYIVTQFVFAADPIITWESANRSYIGQLRYVAGLPGLATLKTLLKYAIDCGVGPSMHALSRHAANLAKLLTVATPDEMLVALARYKMRNPQTHLDGVHFFPFGGLKRTAGWLNKIIEGDFELTGNGLNLKVA